MKEKIKELSKKYGKIDEESLDIEDRDFQKSTIVFDTNILIKIYKLKEETREELFKILENPKINKRLYIPHQILLEFFLKRKDLLKKADGFETKLSEKIATNLNNQILSNICVKKKWTGGFENCFLANEDICAELCELDITKHINAIKSEYEKVISKYKKNKITLNQDPILDRLSKIFENKIGKEIKPKGYNEIKNEVIIKKFSGLPYAGWKDSNKSNGNEYGDFIVWKDLIDNDFEDGVIYVTEEKKSDWVDENENMKLYLKIEYKKATNGKINIINFENFMKRISSIYKVLLNENTLEDLAKASEEVENRMKVRSKINEYYRNVMPFLLNNMASTNNLDPLIALGEFLETLTVEEKLKFTEGLGKNLSNFMKK